MSRAPIKQRAELESLPNEILSLILADIHPHIARFVCWRWKELKPAKPKPISIYIHAIANDYLHLLQWIRDMGAPWDDVPCCEVAKAGRLDLLKKLMSYCCPISKT